MLLVEGWGETASVEFPVHQKRINRLAHLDKRVVCVEKTWCRLNLPWEFRGGGGGGGGAAEEVVDDDDDLSERHWSIFGILIVDLGAIEFDSQFSIAIRRKQK